MGKIARRMHQMMKQTLHQPVVSLKTFADGKKKAQENLSSIRPFKDLCEEGYDPTHALYINSQNLVSCFAEDASMLAPLHIWNDFVVEVEETYTPGCPPMSPITKSYCYLWELFDAGFGEDRETIGSIFISLAPILGVSPLQLEAIKKLSTSRMGIYEVTGIFGKEYELIELLTNKKYRAIIPSGYMGNQGDLLYIRLVPPIDQEVAYYVTMTTPYVLVGTTKDDWIQFFDRNEIKNTSVGYESRLHKVLKHGKNRKYWIEFVFYSYFNHTPDRIFLAGIPDRPGTLSHADEFDQSGLNYAMIQDQILGRFNSKLKGPVEDSNDKEITSAKQGDGKVQKPGLLKTMTNENYQLARLHYKVHNRAEVVKKLSQLKCISFDSTKDCFEWLYDGEARNIGLEVPYEGIPVERRPIILGRIFIKNNGAIIDVNSFTRAVKAVSFFDKHLTKSLFEVTEVEVLNQLFTHQVNNSRIHSEYFDNRPKTKNNWELAEERLAQIEALNISQEKRQEMWMQQTEENAKKPLEKIEKLPVHFYLEGIKDFETSLRMREAIAVQYWLGNKDYSFHKLIQTMLAQGKEMLG